MVPLPPGLPDWRDEAAYRPLLDADRSVLAWEWLRRNSDYRRAAGTALRRHRPNRGMILKEQPEAAIWGLHAFEDPRLGAPTARPVWRAEAYRQVLLAVAEPSAGAGDLFELDRVKGLATLVRGAGGAEHLLLSDGFTGVRLDVVRGSLLLGPVMLNSRLPGFGRVEKSILLLRRLVALWETGSVARSLHSSDRVLPRHVLTLRAHDAVVGGANQREIAARLLSLEARKERWRVTVPSVRSRVQRLTRAARVMPGRGYLKVLKR